MARFGKPTYFEPARFHVTFASVTYHSQGDSASCQSPEKQAETAKVIAEPAAAAAKKDEVVDVVTCDVRAVRGKAGHLRFLSLLSD